MEFITTKGCDLYYNGKIINLKGINAGFFLLTETWNSFFGNVCDFNVIKILERRFGTEIANELIFEYRKCFWEKNDFIEIKKCGMNCIRLPFPFYMIYDEQWNIKLNWSYWFDELLRYCSRYNLFIILDCHSCPGLANLEDHSGFSIKNKSPDKMEIFFGDKKEFYQQKLIDTWILIAQKYKENKHIAGYGLINEPFCTLRYKIDNSVYKQCVYQLYDTLIHEIRKYDNNHVIFLNTCWSPRDLPNITYNMHEFNWSNVVYEYHLYPKNSKFNEQKKFMNRKLNAIIKYRLNNKMSRY